MRHLFPTWLRVVLIVAVLLAVSLFAASFITKMTVPALVDRIVITPARAGADFLKGQAEQIYSYMFNYEALQAENTALKEQISQMEDDARVADSVSRENDRLRALLELMDAHEDYELVDAYIIAWGAEDWSNTLTINRGSNVGIEAGMCAITADGEVVGQVMEVGTNYAVVKTVLDSSLGISAAIASSGYNGIVQGNYTGSDEDLLRMSYLPSSSVIRNNDQVITSGSTTYPKGLILGYVVDADFDDTGVAKFALLRPAADIDTLEQVFILTDYNAG